MHRTQKLKHLLTQIQSAITLSENIDHFERTRENGLYSEKGVEHSQKLLDVYRPVLGQRLEEVAALSSEFAPQQSQLDAIVHALGSNVEDSVEMRKHLADWLKVVTHRHATGRLQLLSERERELLTTGMAETRHGWDQSWIGDIVQSGYIGTDLLTDLDLIHDALCDNLCLDNVTGADQVGILTILAREDILSIVVDRFHTFHDQDAMEGFVNTLLRLDSSLNDHAAHRAEVRRLTESIVEKIEAAADESAHTAASAPAPEM